MAWCRALCHRSGICGIRGMGEVTSSPLTASALPSLQVRRLGHQPCHPVLQWQWLQRRCGQHTGHLGTKVGMAAAIFSAVRRCPNKLQPWSAKRCRSRSQHSLTRRTLQAASASGGSSVGCRIVMLQPYSVLVWRGIARTGELPHQAPARGRAAGVAAALVHGRTQIRVIVRACPCRGQRDNSRAAPFASGRLAAMCVVAKAKQRSLFL